MGIVYFYLYPNRAAAANRHAKESPDTDQIKITKRAAGYEFFFSRARIRVNNHRVCGKTESVYGFFRKKCLSGPDGRDQ